jgi:hypothetical protein
MQKNLHLLNGLALINQALLENLMFFVQCPWTLSIVHGHFFQKSFFRKYFMDIVFFSKHFMDNVHGRMDIVHDVWTLSMTYGHCP